MTTRHKVGRSNKPNSPEHKHGNLSRPPPVGAAPFLSAAKKARIYAGGNIGSWYHEYVRNECSALAGKVMVRKASNGLFAIVTTDPDARQKIAKMFGIRLIK